MNLPEPLPFWYNRDSDGNGYPIHEYLISMRACNWEIFGPVGSGSARPEPTDPDTRFRIWTHMSAALSTLNSAQPNPIGH